MLCAGLTAYSPLVRNGVGPGKKVGIVGMYVAPVTFLQTLLSTHHYTDMSP
jgi:D-arabinose 1-dehydrogenase-like Zn-dependent alcohol dehydrogenase